MNQSPVAVIVLVPADASGRLGRQAGAVAFDDAALTEARAGGIGRAVRFQWERATAQAVPALVALGRPKA